MCLQAHSLSAYLSVVKTMSFYIVSITLPVQDAYSYSLSIRLVDVLQHKHIVLSGCL